LTATRQSLTISLFLFLLLLIPSACESDPVHGDTTRPARVTDLSLDRVEGNTLFFSWTATGDDINSGTAFLYDLRYAFSQSILESWGGATTVLGEPIPSEPGTGEEMALELQLLDSTYYFGLKVSDDSRNTSPLSNIVILMR
jgi:hypothetical protein